MGMCVKASEASWSDTCVAGGNGYENGPLPGHIPPHANPCPWMPAGVGNQANRFVRASSRRGPEVPPGISRGGGVATLQIGQTRELSDD